MAGITLAQAETKLNEYLAAETNVLSGQAYSIAGRSMTRANLREIRDGMSYWNEQVRDLTLRASGRRRSRTIAPLG